MLLLMSGAATACLTDPFVRQPELTVVPGAPAGWSGTAGTPGIGITISDVRTGNNAAYLTNGFQSNFGSFRIFQTVRADNYRGKRVRLSAWVKPRNVASVASAGIFMRIDGPGLTLAVDDMVRRPVFGNGDWREVSVVLDVPTRAIGISLGMLFQAANTLLVDDMHLEVVGETVATTNTLEVPVPNGLDSLSTIEAYARSPFSPTNLDFEGLTSLGGATSAWIARNGVALTSTDPAATANDLAPLQAIVGDASVVALGDATNGTREFLRIKERLSRFLVASMGFNTIAIDAPAAETEELNVYVLGGPGDPARLVSRLYAWQLNTQEMVDLVAWLRQWNSTRASGERVQLLGLDVQYPGTSMDSVADFVRRVAPEYAVDITVWYECLSIFRNRGATPGRPRSDYAIIPVDAKALCAEGINDAVNLVTTRGVGAVGYDGAVRNARLVQQFESVATSNSAAAATRARDLALANNVLAMRERRGPNARIVVWAHNDRVTRQSGAMGARLAALLGADYRPIGFAFGTGRFNALLQQTTTATTPQPFTAQVIPTGSIEEAAVAASGSALLIDMRTIGVGSADAAPLAGPIAMRTIGLGFNPNTERAYFPIRLFPADFDALLFIRETTPSTLLPFVN
jgi:erythromycin esterase